MSNLSYGYEHCPVFVSNLNHYCIELFWFFFQSCIHQAQKTSLLSNCSISFAHFFHSRHFFAFYFILFYSVSSLPLFFKFYLLRIRRTQKHLVADLDQLQPSFIVFSSYFIFRSHLLFHLFPLFFFF